MGDAPPAFIFNNIFGKYSFFIISNLIDNNDPYALKPA